MLDDAMLCCAMLCYAIINYTVLSPHLLKRDGGHHKFLREVGMPPPSS